MINLITGMAGAGKTTTAINTINELINEDRGTYSLIYSTFSHFNRRRIQGILNDTIDMDSVASITGRVFHHLKYDNNREFWLKDNTIILFDELTLMPDSLDFSILLDILELATNNPSFHVIITLDINQTYNSNIGFRLLKLAISNSKFSNSPEHDLTRLMDINTPKELIAPIYDSNQKSMDIFTTRNINIDNFIVLFDNYRNDKILGNNGLFWWDKTKFFGRNYDKDGFTDVPIAILKGISTVKDMFEGSFIPNPGMESEETTILPEDTKLNEFIINEVNKFKYSAAGVGSETVLHKTNTNIDIMDELYEYYKDGYTILTTSTIERDMVIRYISNREYSVKHTDIVCGFSETKGDLAIPTKLMYRIRAFNEDAYDICVGQEIMAIDNDYNSFLGDKSNGRRFLNGDKCIIVRARQLVTNDPRTIQMVIYNEDNDLTFEVPLNDFYNQFSPRFCMCITKGQGSSFDKVVIFNTDKYGSSTYNILYTGVSRAVDELVILSNNYTKFIDRWHTIYDPMSDWNGHTKGMVEKLNNLSSLITEEVINGDDDALSYSTEDIDALYEKYMKTFYPLDGGSDADSGAPSKLTFARYISTYKPELLKNNVSMLFQTTNTLLNNGKDSRDLINIEMNRFITDRGILFSKSNNIRAYIKNPDFNLDNPRNYTVGYSLSHDMFIDMKNTIDRLSNQYQIPLTNVYPISNTRRKSVYTSYKKWCDSHEESEIYNKWGNLVSKLSSEVITIPSGGRYNQIYKNARYLLNRGADLFSTIYILINQDDYSTMSTSGTKDFVDDRYFFQILSAYESIAKSDRDTLSNSNRTITTGKKYANMIEHLEMERGKEDRYYVCKNEDPRPLNAVYSTSPDSKVPAVKWGDDNYSLDITNLPECGKGKNLGIKLTMTNYIVIDVDNNDKLVDLITRFPALRDTYRTYNISKSIDGSSDLDKQGSVHFYIETDHCWKTKHVQGIDILGNYANAIVWETNNTKCRHVVSGSHTFTTDEINEMYDYILTNR